MQHLEELAAVARRGAAAFPALPRALLALRGKDRVSFLHNLVSHDIKGLQPGQARLACLLDRQGKILFAALVHCRSEELLLELDPSQLRTASDQLKRYRVSEQVEFQDCTPELAILPLHGPAAPEILRGLSDPDLPAPARRDLFGVPGFHLCVPRDRAADFLSKVTAAGAREAPLELFHALRIEAGVPWPPFELNDGVILNELGTEEYVSFTKGCFVGQEIVARIKHRAHPPRLLRGLLFQGRALPPVPNPILDLQGKPVGLLTSCCLSPATGNALGLGFVAFGLPDKTPCTVASPAGDLRAETTPLHP